MSFFLFCKTYFFLKNDLKGHQNELDSIISDQIQKNYFFFQVKTETRFKERISNIKIIELQSKCFHNNETFFVK